MERKPKALVLVVVSTLAASATAYARPIDLELGYRRFGSDLWDRFSGFNTQSPAAWDAGPAQGEARSMLEPSVRWQKWDRPWGTLGLSATVTLPASVESTGTPQGLSEIRKETSVWGYRVGPNARFYLTPDPGWFVDGSVAIGQLIATQNISGAASGGLTALAYSFELGVAIGYEWKPSAGTSLFAKLGYSRFTSSYFSSQSTSGSFYGDMDSGTRVAVTGPGGNEDLKLNASGLLLTVGFRFETGKKASKWSRIPERAAEKPAEKAGTDWESTPTPEATPAPAPSPTNDADSATPPPSATPAPTSAPAPVPHDLDPTQNPDLLPPSPAPTVVLDPEPAPLPEPSRRMDLPPGMEEPPSPMAVPEPTPTGIDTVPDMEDAPANLRPERAGRETYRALED